MLHSTAKHFRQRWLAKLFAGMRMWCSQKRQLQIMARRALAYWQGSATMAAFSAWSGRTREGIRTKEKVVQQYSSLRIYASNCIELWKTRGWMC